MYSKENIIVLIQNKYFIVGANHPNLHSSRISPLKAQYLESGGYYTHYKIY